MPLPLFLGIAAAAAAGAKVVKNQVEQAKATDAIIEEAEARCAKEALEHKSVRTETEIQKKMRRLLLKHGFSSDTVDKDKIYSDWKCIPKDVEIAATRKGALFSWGEHAVYTFDAVYYQHRKKGVHEVLYYDYINDFDRPTGIVDYGPMHQKRSVAHWDDFEKRMIEQLNHIWKMDSENDTSILEFCFNRSYGLNTDMRRNCTCETENVCKKEYANGNALIQQNLSNIRIVSMIDGRLEVQFCMHFPKIENVRFNENDTEEEIWEKEREQERREEEAEHLEWEAYDTHEKLISLSSIIAEIYQKAIYNLYGVLFSKENITLLETPDFTYEGPSFFDKVEGVASTAQGAYSKLADITQSRMEEARRDYERKNKSGK